MSAPPADVTVVDGVALPAGRYRVHGVSRARFLPTLGLLALGLGSAMLGLAVWDDLAQDASTYVCPPDCGRPPAAAAVAEMPRFVAPDGKFSVGHPGADAGYTISTGPDGVTARRFAGDGGVLRLVSAPARGRVARQVVNQLIAEQYPNAAIAYELPNAAVGYQLGYGVVANFQPPGISTRYETRIIIMAAVRHDLALIAVAEGPFRRFSRDFGPGPPSAANLEIAMDMGRFVESFAWAGDPPR